MGAREPNDVSPPPRPNETLLVAWDLLSAAMGVGVAVMALEEGRPFFDSLVTGIRLFGVLVGGFRIVAAVGIHLVLPLLDVIEYKVLSKRADWQVRRMMRRPLRPAAPRAPTESLYEVGGASVMKRADVEKEAAPTSQAEGSGETAHLAEIAARFLAGKPLSALTDGLSPATAAALTAVLADAGRLLEDNRRSSSKTTSPPTDLR